MKAACPKACSSSVAVQAILLMVLALSIVSSVRADSVELKTGERVEGRFRQATAAGAVIEVAGQAITIPLEKLKAIYFGAAPAAAVAGPAPSQDALDSLASLRSVTNSGIAYRDYSQRVLDARVRVDRFLSAHASEDSGLNRSIRVAMLEYELVSYALNPDKADLLRTMGKIVQDPDVAKCSALKNLTDNNLSKQQLVLKDVIGRTAALGRRLSQTTYVPDQTDELGLTFVANTIPPASIWACASEQIAEAERSQR